MRSYLFRRILLSIPALLFIVLLSFILLHLSPGDPVERILSNQGIYDNEFITIDAEDKYKSELREKLGLNLPLFYFKIYNPAESTSSWKRYIPHILFSADNQFHRWLFGSQDNGGLIRGDLGNSWITGEKVSSLISGRIGWSLLLTLTSVILAYLVSIPVGLKAASFPGSLFDRFTGFSFMVLFSLPSFWIATLLMFAFCNPHLFNILPSSGVGPVGGFEDDIPLLNRIATVIPYLILPTICYTYSSFAFLSKFVKESVSEILREDYITTARAKGLEEKRVIGHHAYRNALVPLITIFSQVFPYAIGGSVILETIFSIPGMGLAIYHSILAQDYPVVIAVFLITGLITMGGFLLSDVLYAFADPRVTLMRQQQS